MLGELIAMNAKELERLAVVRKIVDKDRARNNFLFLREAGH